METPQEVGPVEAENQQTLTNDVPLDNTIRTAGDRACYCYVSLNLTCNTRNAEIISIGAMDSDGDRFYGEITNYNMKNVTPYVFEHVIKNLLGDKKDAFFKTEVGTYDEIREKFITWVYEHYQPKDRFVQFVMDKVSWDWPILKEFISGNPDEYPDWMSHLVVDLNNDLANVVTVSKSTIDATIKGEDTFKNFVPNMIVEKEVDRIETTESIGNNSGIIMMADNDNALKKAMCIRAIHQSIWGYDASLRKDQ